VIVDIGNGRYIMYAHLIPGSVTVAVNDEVSAGQVLGKLGDSGNASAPHLHFQVMDRPSPLGAHGLPFVFNSMDREATIPGTVIDELDDIGDGTPVRLDHSTAKHFDNTLPLTRDVLTFQ
jgi:murein DD-endopeptidase MepM/ murein hydrolase activator NlpD